ncbi:MAG TPA: hypothetical protein DDZ51_10245, partial [Planctomycetaceae bacterium]|nr:hypothetical protein [Planctomycetaceae bacterium]
MNQGLVVGVRSGRLINQSLGKRQPRPKDSDINRQSATSVGAFSRYLDQIFVLEIFRMRQQRDFRLGTLLAAIGLVSSLIPLAAEAQTAPISGGELASRVATYEDASGQGYFAASVQPPADDALLKLVGGGPARLSIVIDTSASQGGAYRADQMSALNAMLAGLRAGDTVQLFAADVSTTALCQPIDAKDLSAIRGAVDKLSRRLPLGNTNLSASLETARASLLAGARGETRSLVYIGDAASIELASDSAKFETLVDALRADQIAVHGIAVGPTKNIA